MGGILRAIRSAVVVGIIVVGSAFPASATEADKPDLKAEFFQLCDAARADVLEQAVAFERKGRAFYWDSYAVRALAVAYDLTGKQEYLDACKLWSDHMIEFQEAMTPRGAYYMQYGRKPGEKEGNWYVADCSSIALGVLATAIRCQGKPEYERYLASVKAFADLVADNWVRPTGGVTDGYWPKSDKEWWCSTGIYGSLAFCLYKETGDDRYLKMGRGAIDWLNRQDLLTVAEFFPPHEIKPTVMMYCLEAYSPAWPHLEPDSDLYKAAVTQFQKAQAWMAENLEDKTGIPYISQWGSKFGGLPFHLYVYAGHAPGNQQAVALADRQLRHIAGVLAQSPPSGQRDQLALFGLVSYAEKISPGSIYRTSKK
jgi:hypothetical protein